MKGPKGRFLYKRNMVPRIGMIAGGTGITPCLQVLKSALSDTADKTRFDLLYANVTEDEILLRDEVEALAATHPTRLSVYYFLNVPPAGWTQGTGFITKEAISERLPGPDKSRILMCGPPPMMEAMKKHLAALQFQVPGVISKMEDVRWPHTTDNSKYLLFNLDILYCIRRPSTSESASPDSGCPCHICLFSDVRTNSAGGSEGPTCSARCRPPCHLHLPSRSNHVGRLVCGVYYRGADHCPVGIFWERGPCVCLSCLTIADIVHDTRSFAMLLGAAIAGKASTVALEYYRKGSAGRSFSALTQKFPRNLVLCLSLWSAHAADTWSITLSRTDSS